MTEQNRIRSRSRAACWNALVALVATVVLVLVLAAAAPAGAAAPTWTTTTAMRIGAAGTQTAQHVAIGSGNTYISGTFTGTVAFGPGAGQTLTATGSGNAYLAAYNPLGTLKWVHRIGSGIGDQIVGIGTYATGKVTVIGQSYGATHVNTPYGDRVLTAHGNFDVFLVQFDPNDGHLDWAQQYGGTGNDTAGGVATNSVGVIYAVGTYSNSVTFGLNGGTTYTLTSAGGTDGFLARFDQNGGLYNATTVVSGPSTDSVTGIGIGNGMVVVAGTWKGTADVAGTTFSTTYPASFVARLDATTGAGTWVRMLRPSGLGKTSTVNSVAIAPDSSIYIGGTVFSLGTQSSTLFYAPGALNQTAEIRPVGASDAFVARYFNNGLFSWAHLSGARQDLPTTSGDPGRTGYGLGLTVGSDSSVFEVGSADSTFYVNGVVDSSTNGGQDAFVSQRSSNGTVVRWTRFGGPGDDQAQGVAGPATAPTVVGSFDSAFTPPGAASQLTPTAQDGYALLLAPT